ARAPAPDPVQAPPPAAAPARRAASAPSIEHDPFERDLTSAVPVGAERFVVPLIVACLGVLGVLLLSGLVAALLP
ncbi:hypothetical protein, partial [Actinomadura sp. GC306]|uniref:hypothetical protein n=1 Tax=Actinomadura sp. GC306 TaxID=2530367 RepID=UPI001A9EB2AD